MISEKIKQHSPKIMLFAINILLIVVGVGYLKQKKYEDSMAKILNRDIADSAKAQEYAQKIQDEIIQDQNNKQGSISANSGTITKQQTTTVSRTIPAVTKQVTVPSSTTTSKTTKTS
jgi:hypothetical protein